MHDADAKTLEKIRALMDRAVHPSTPIEEARTAALIAIRMAKEAGLELMAAADRAELTEFRKSAERFRDAQARVNGDSKAGETSDPSAVFCRRPRRRAEPSRGDYAIVVSAYKGFFCSCRRQYAEGDEIAYRRGSGATHYKCRSFWDQTASDKAR